VSGVCREAEGQIQKRDGRIVIPRLEWPSKKPARLDPVDLREIARIKKVLRFFAEKNGHVLSNFGMKPCYPSTKHKGPFTAVGLDPTFCEAYCRRCDARALVITEFEKPYRTIRLALPCPGKRAYYERFTDNPIIDQRLAIIRALVAARGMQWDDKLGDWVPVRAE